MPAEGISSKGFGPEGDPGALSARLQVSRPESSQRAEQVVKDLSSARKTHKADREKLRRDRLNEQFMDLGNALDSDRPRNDKATIIADAILMLKDLTAEVQKLRAEHTSLSDESRELIQEKNELREEKAALKSEIDSLSVQYQPRLGCLYPWAAVDPSVVMRPPSPYPFPVPVPVTSSPMPFHLPIPLYPFFQNQSQVAVPSPCSSYHPYGSSNPHIEQQPIQPLPSHPHAHPSNNNNNTAYKHESQSNPVDQRGNGSERSSAEVNDVVTELELKMPGSASPSSDSKTATNEQNSPSEGRRGCRSRKLQNKGSENSDASRCFSPPGMPASSSTSNGGDSADDGS